MPKSYRFRTEVGVDREVRLNIEQDFDTLEVLSLKLRQEDLYSRFCADYGVVAGRVVANGGFGVPNVSVSIFVPLDNIDEEDPVISTLYPYKSLRDKNEDGYRYNLLPYEQENSGHTPTGTFPTREDVLGRNEVLHIYEKYYKFTVRTNLSGDFMIVGVPLGEQKLVVDIDLSNMGKFSLRPDDLIRMGLGTKEQFNGNKFKASENLDALPQIIHEVYDINVSSFWGEEDICDVGITRIDVDLRDLGIDIQPRAIFMGSIMSSSEDDFIKPNCKPKNDVGKLCDMITGAGTILALRQGFDKDDTNRPIIEEFKFEDNGYVIDENGAWLVELPMNLSYVTTNEFGEEIISNDPSVGIPTEGKYRFKIGWLQEDQVNNEIHRADYLVPNIKEHGWTGPQTYLRPSENILNKSYAFSLDWDDYYDYEAAIRCEDTFYNFYYNKVYSVAGHVDRFKFGRGRQKHLGIKEINDRRCTAEHNKYPVNDAQRNGSLLIILFNYLITITIPLFIQTIIFLHALAVVWGIIIFILKILSFIVNFVYTVLCYAVVVVMNIITLGFTNLNFESCDEPLIPEIGGNIFKNIAIPMLTYPDCEMCKCTPATVDGEDSELLDELNETLSQFPQSGALTVTSASNPQIFKQDDMCLDGTFDADIDPQSRNEVQAMMAVTGYDARTDKYYESIYGGKNDFADWYKSPVHIEFDRSNNSANIRKWHLSTNPTWSQAINLLNKRANYFYNNFYTGDDLERRAGTAIKIEYVNDQLDGVDSTSDPVYDRVMIMLTKTKLTKAQLVTFNDPQQILDENIGKRGYYDYNENGYVDKVIEGITPLGGIYQANVKLYSPNSDGFYNFTSGVEYFQVIQSEKLSELLPNWVNWNGSYQGAIRYTFTGWNIEYACSSGYGIGSIDDYAADGSDTNWNTDHIWNSNEPQNKYLGNIQSFTNADQLYVTVMVRGVDPNSPKQKIKYDLSRLYGYGEFDNVTNLNQMFPGVKTVTGEFYMNVPMQSNIPNNTSGLNDIVGNGGLWRYGQYTPTPHYRHTGFGTYVDSNNYNVTEQVNSGVSLGIFGSLNFTINQIETPKLWNESYLFNFIIDNGDDSENPQEWTEFSTLAPTKYVSMDSSLYDAKIQATIPPGIFDDYNWPKKLLNQTISTNNYIKNNDMSDSIFESAPGQQRLRYFSPIPYPRSSYKQNDIAGVGYQYSRKDSNNNNEISSNPRDVISLSPLYLSIDANLADIHDTENKQARTKIISPNNIVFRSDRLPAGDYWDEPAREELQHQDSIFWRRYALQMSLTQTMFSIDDDGTISTLNDSNYGIVIGQADMTGEALDYGDDVVDYSGQNETKVSEILSSFECGTMLPLECYTGSGENFEAIPAEECETNPLFNMFADTRLVNGCYMLVTKNLILSIPADIAHYLEWRTRMRFMFAVCQGVIGETFQNNWVNGNLYMPSFKKKSIYGFAVSQNEVINVGFNGLNSEILTIDYSGSAIILPNDYDETLNYEIYINNELVGENISGFPFNTDEQIQIVITQPQDLPNGFTISLDVTRYPRYKYCGDPEQNSDNIRHKGPLYFNNQTNTFYYRSTPYNDSTNSFVGQLESDGPTFRSYPGANTRNIWFPTTVVDLGPKNEFAYEVTYDPEFESYFIDKLRTSSYGSTDNIVNVFLISRLRNAGFFQNLLGLGDASIGQLFSRATGYERFYDARVDGDFAQLVSISSELGVDPLIEGSYVDDEIFLDEDNIGVFFNSDTILRRKLNGGVMTYGDSPTDPDYIHGYLRDQRVPYYMWTVKKETSENEPANVFGSEFNNWNTINIQSGEYQSDDFFNGNPVTYMKPDVGYGLGHIYNRSVNDDTFSQYPATPSILGSDPQGNNSYKVGSPFHFYFGLKRGKSSLNRFIKQYIELS